MVTLTNVGTSYTWYAGLPAGRLDFTGATELTFWVRHNKVGAGTQFYRLFNVTDNAQLAEVSDAGATGTKELEVTAAVNLTGVKKIRVEARSSTATDDPVFHAWDVFLT